MINLASYYHPVSWQYRKVLILLYGFAMWMSFELNGVLTACCILVLSVLGYRQWTSGVPTTLNIHPIERIHITLDTGLFMLLRVYGLEAQQWMVIFSDQWSQDAKRKLRWALFRAPER